MGKYLFVEQYDKNAHEHRWIFEKEDFFKQLPDCEIYEDGTSNVVIYNGNECRIKELDTKDECFSCLVNGEFGVDCLDPQPIELAEYYLTLDDDMDSITKEIIMQYGIPEHLLHRKDIRFHQLIAAGFPEEDFYDTQLDMSDVRFSALLDICQLGKYQRYKERIDNDDFRYEDLIEEEFEL